MSKAIKRIKRRKLITQIAVILLTVTLLVTGSVYFTLFFLDTSNMRVSVDRNGREGGLVLYDNPRYMGNPGVGRPTLNLRGPRYLDHFTYQWLPAELWSEDTEGDHSGEDYLANTFFLRNASDSVLYYNYEILLLNPTKGVDAAIRIMIIRDGNEVVYARAAADGGRERIWAHDDPAQDRLATNFLSNSRGVVAQAFSLELEPNAFTVYTVVMWIEGHDPECTNSILGGQFSMEIRFTV
jgi:hypothetical protein